MEQTSYEILGCLLKYSKQFLFQKVHSSEKSFFFADATQEFSLDEGKKRLREDSYQLCAKANLLHVCFLH